VDADRNYMDGGKNYRLHLPPPILVKSFWSIIPYDTQTRSVLQTDLLVPAMHLRRWAGRFNCSKGFDNLVSVP
jgi:hypothetical protein